MIMPKDRKMKKIMDLNNLKCIAIDEADYV